VAVTHAGPAWMVIGADTVAELATAKAAGATHGMVAARWSDLQTTSGGAVNAATVTTNINDVVAAGLKVCLRVAPQYIPTFVDTAGVKLRRNGAVDWTATGASGANVRDWVWSASTRALLQDFLTKLFVQIDWTKVERVQLGGLVFGELSYPTTDGTQWWGFSAPAQTGTDLAASQVVCPVPGWVPSTGTTWVANDIAFHAWYRDSLINFMTWFIAQHRAFFAGPIYVLHPGAGLRAVSQTPTSSGQALNFRKNAAAGLHWVEQLTAYPDAQVYPYSTWADSVHFWPPDPYSDVNDGNAAPWYHLLRVARATGRAARIWGENTGNQTNTDMDRIFADGAVAHGYQGFTWLQADTLVAGGTAATYANFTARITTANAAFGGGLYGRGVNMAGAEFAASPATLPGTYGADYAYDSAASFTSIAARGHKLVRLPFRWERIQPTRGAALNTTELGRLQSAVAAVSAAGMECVLDVHNYARYINSSANGGAELVLGDTLSAADLVDLWTRLSTAFRGNAGIYAYGLMNEPHDLPGTAGSFSGVVRYDWNDGTVQGWTGDTAAASNVGSKLRLSATATAGFFLLRKDDAALKRGGALTGSSLQAVVTLGASVAGSWRATLQWQTAGFQWQSPTTTTYTRVDTGAVVGGLIAGVAVAVSATWSGGITSPNAFAIQVDANNAAAGAVTVDIDDFSQGTVSGGASGAQTWESVSQQVVTAIRANSDSTKILVGGYGFAGAQTWTQNHPDPWITGGGDVAYEAHYYFDVDNSGDYPATYATENASAVSAGYASLTSRVAHELSPYLTWLVRYGVRGFIGETGWTHTESTSSWNAVGDAVYDELDRYGVDATYWSAGERWGSTYNLSAYTGTTQTTLQAQSSVIEAHPSTLTITPPPPPPGGGAATGLARRNLAPNPAMKVDTVGWSAVSNTGTVLADWVRSTSLDVTLPRTTGFKGTSAGDVLTPRAAVTAGQSYYWAVSVKAVVDLSANMLVNFHTALSGGTFVANSGPTVPLNLAAGAVGRFVLGPFAVPATATAGYLKLNDLDGAAEVTAYQVESAATFGAYFDGDSTGASWDGAAGDSTSTIRQLLELMSISDTFGRATVAVGPFTSEPVSIAESFSIAATGFLRETIRMRESFLITSLEWDPTRGRNRVSAFKFGSDVVRVRVSRRPVGGGSWQAVRGGDVDVVAGFMARRVDDYEFPSGVDLEYRIEGLTGAASGATVAQVATVRRKSVADSVWLKFITSPALNRRVDFMGRTEIQRDARTAVYQVQNRSDPVVVSDVHSSRQFAIRVKTETQAETDALDHALSQGLPCYLQVPASINTPSIYAVIGSYSFEAPALKSARNVFTIPLTEVSPPPPSIVSPQATWQQLIDQYPTWEDVLAAVPRWLDTAD
jgi:hypothetical protein